MTANRAFCDILIPKISKKILPSFSRRNLITRKTLIYPIKND